jgi:hypothetical protein|tara:strand:- start:1658 stop:2083 length:426 start_codon:yes stop_codon:yes gene_type:complete
MGNKEDLQEMLDKLSEDELSALGDLIGKASNKPRNRRRGRGKRKKKKTSTPSPKQPNFLDNINLSADEQNELKAAIKFDKEKGVDKPKSDGIMIPKGPSFKKASIQCMDCKKTLEISPSLIPPERGRFRCNSCICKGRSRE